MKEQMFHGGNLRLRAESFVMPKSLTLQAETPYAKDGEIVFMSDRKIDELARQTEQAQNPDFTRVAHPDPAMHEFQDLFDKWRQAHPGDADLGSARTNQIIAEMGLHPSPFDVHQNAQLSDEDRLEKVNSILLAQGGKPLTPEQEKAILSAHYVGNGETGMNGEAAGVYNYTQEQLLKKGRALSGFTPEQRRVLMEAGLVGAPDAFDYDGEGAYEGPGFDYSGSTTGGAPEIPDTSTTSESTEELTPEEIIKQNARQQGIDHNNKQERNIKERINNTNDPKKLADLLEKGVTGHVNRIGKKLARPTDASKEAMEIAVEMFAEPYLDLLAKAVDQINEPDGVENAKRVADQVMTEVFKRDRDEYWANYDPTKINERSKSREGQINNMIDVVDSIMQTDPGRWGTVEFNQKNGLNDGKEGDFPLIEDGKVNQANFIRWVREKMVEQHNFDPDSPVNFFSAVAVENPNVYRTVNLQTMTQNFGIYFRDSDGNVLKDLKDEVVNLAWLGGTVRNMDVQYRQEMSNDSRFADMLVGLFKSNTFGKENTKGINTFASMFTMDEEYTPPTIRVKERDKEGNVKIVEKPNPKKGDMKLGHALRTSYLIYYNLTDPEKIQKLFPHDLKLYDESEMRAVIDNLRGAAPEKEFLKEAGISDIWSYYKDGKVDPEKIKKFSEVINVFYPPTKNRTQIQIFRKLIGRTAAWQAGLVKKDNPAQIDDDNADFPELMAYLMTYWTGAASRQDTGFAALNAFTKTEHFKGYLYKQADPSRAGGIGNVRQIELLNKITVDPLLGINTTSKETTLEMLEKMQEISNRRITPDYTEEHKQADLEKVRRSWSYDDRAWSQYAPQHVGNGFKEFHDRTSGKQVKFESFVHYEVSTGRYTYDTDKMIAEVQESIIKPTRYRWSTHKINFGYEQRTLKVKTEHAHKHPFWDKFRWTYPHHHKEESKEPPEYENKTIAESMFGPQVLLTAQEIMRHEHVDGFRTFLKEDGTVIRENGKVPDDIVKLLNGKDFGRVVSKSYILCKFATMLYYNTTRNGPGHLMDIPTRELVIHGIGSINAGVAGDPEDFRNTEITEKYFTDFDLMLLRKMSKNERWRNNFKHARDDLTAGTFGGVAKAFKVMSKEMFKF